MALLAPIDKKETQHPQVDIKDTGLRCGQEAQEKQQPRDIAQKNPHRPPQNQHPFLFELAFLLAFPNKNRDFNATDAHINLQNQKHISQ
ncbi:MAG: hypothetical protein IV090_18965 [Candidatus Sericytochromatia bacterium]|nr:hypothetical protein [Candidatus Sericytochromatia bacterium]